MKAKVFFLYACLCFFLAIMSCKHEPIEPGNDTPNTEDTTSTNTDTTIVTANCNTTNITTDTIALILQAKCVLCHNPSLPSGNILLDNNTGIEEVGANGRLWGSVNALEGYVAMPQGGDMLDSCSLAKIWAWMQAQGYAWPPNTEPTDTTTDTTNIVICDPSIIYFNTQIQPLLQSNCAISGCHDAATHAHNVNVSTYQSTMQKPGLVNPGNPNNSELYEVLFETGEDKMPPYPYSSLSQEQKELLYNWILQGAQNTICEGETCITENQTYTNDIFPIFQSYCIGCHNATLSQGNLNLTNYSATVTVANNGKLLGTITHANGYNPMPPTGNLPNCEISKIQAWINDGTPQ
ncbi:MAG: hypothetical protein R2798_03905 [Chitinophagales bacterium]|nr:hypothetical protein [Bacteroidota bacterium]